MRSARSIKPSVGRPTADARAPRLRGAVTNGRRLFVEGDGNSAWSRRYRDLIAGHIADMGGRDLLSEAQLSLVKRASAIEVDLDSFTRAASHLRRILETLGLRCAPRDVTPTLSQYLARIGPDELRGTGEGEPDIYAPGEEACAAGLPHRAAL
jgi:hypothetical protein